MSICRGCGEEFTPKRPKSLTCSKRCNTRYFHRVEAERRRAAKQTAACAECGVEFVKFRQSSRTCSTACYNELVKRELREARAAARVEIECEVCGVRVVRRLQSQRRCGSSKCQSAYRTLTDRDHDARLRRQFGISLEQYDRMYADQRGKCAICLKECATGRRLAVDHDHRTGAIRGLLCFRCNVGIGKFDDNPALLRVAAHYLNATTPKE